MQQSTTANDEVWGAAYRIIPNKVKEVQEYLDIRETNGYSIQYTPFHPADAKYNEIRCMVYIGMPDNPQFLGAQHPADVAKTISISRGQSGENREYLFQLEQSLNMLNTESADEHVSDLTRRVRALLRLPSGEKIEEAAVVHLQKASSTEEQEEIEKNE
jgi:glutathione-specific gamma-glutamylcyclotransferase